MNADKLAIAKAVESRQEKFWKISDAIWSYAELGLEEYRSSKLLADTIEAAGFKVDRGVAGMPTAFVATWSHGSGRPIIGFLGEYDALPMLSQKAGVPKKDPLVPGAPGHGCSHNTMCTAQALTVITLKEFMEKKGLSGTLKLFGSPAEEILTSRPFMVRAGLFEGIDVVLDCHGDSAFQVAYGMEGHGHVFLHRDLQGEDRPRRFLPLDGQERRRCRGAHARRNRAHAGTSAHDPEDPLGHPGGGRGPQRGAGPGLHLVLHPGPGRKRGEELSVGPGLRERGGPDDPDDLRGQDHRGHPPAVSQQTPGRTRL